MNKTILSPLRAATMRERFACRMPAQAALLSLLLLLFAVNSPAYYPYWWSSNFSSGTLPSGWHVNAPFPYSLPPSDSNVFGYLTGCGSLIYPGVAPDGTSNYEVKLRLDSSPIMTSGVAALLRASPDAMPGSNPGNRFTWAAQGTYYSVEVQRNNLVVNMRQNGVLTTLASTPAPFQWNSVIRAVMQGPKNMILVWLDNVLYIAVPAGTIQSGSPGVAVWQDSNGSNVWGGEIQEADLGPLDTIAPAPIAQSAITGSAYPDHVDLQWQAPADYHVNGEQYSPQTIPDPNDTGAAIYKIYRNGQLLTTPYGTTQYSDRAVLSSTSYTYTIYTGDYHYNFETTGVTVTLVTPPAGTSVPADQTIGVRPTGAYWGAGGEQIDLQSGNLNFTLPLLKAQGRGGTGAAFALSCNSRLWRQDSGGVWKLGEDVGYGFGWRLQAGSLVPYLSGGLIQYYIFTDSTGAEYRLNVNNNNIWTSQEGLYVEYDATALRLYFPDGSFWVMGSISAGTEQDAGTRYPTLIEDTNGNQILIRYLPAIGFTFPNSSARIGQIEDARAVSVSGGRATYQFTYNSDSIPHLTGIANSIQSGETFSFAYLENQALTSPFGDGTAFGTTTLLQQATNTARNDTFAFAYPGGSGELGTATLPKGGSLGWAYAPFTYSSGATFREVQNRYLTKAAGAAQTTYTFSHDSGVGAVHAQTVVTDPSGPAKAWFFDTAGPATLGLVTSREDRVSTGGSATRQQNYTWTQDAAGTPYIATVLTTLDPGTAYQAQSQTTETLDTHGNVTQTNIYDYNNLTTPARTYVNTYLTNGNYTSQHIWSRLVSSTVNGTALVTNAYDQNGLTDRPGILEHDSNYGTSFAYRGNVTQTVTPGAVRNVSYDIGGAVVTANDNNGHSVAVTLSSATNYTAPSALAPNSNSNLGSSYTYSGFLGITSATDPNASTATVAYDTAARPSQTTSPDGAVTYYSYTTNTAAATTNGHWRRNTLDGLGRTVTMTAGDSGGTKSEVDSVYGPCACSPLGKLKQVSQPYAPGGTPVWTTYTYDALGRTVQIALPGGTGTVAYAYQGNTTTVTDAAGKWKTYTRDALGNLVHVTEPAPEGGTHETSYVYNVLNQLTQVSMPRGGVTQTRTFNYDPATARLMSATNPESGTVSYTYNADGTVAAKTDAKGQKIAYTYDSYGRTTQVQRYNASGAADPCQQTSITYDTWSDNAGFFTTANSWGRMTSYQSGGLDPAQCPPGQFLELFSYTPSGRVTRKVLAVVRNTIFNRASLEADFTWDNEGKRTSIAYPSTYVLQSNGSYVLQAGPVFTDTYDTMSRPVGLTSNGVAWVSNVAYGPSNELLQMKRLTAIVGGPAYGWYDETRTYNARLQLTRLTVNNDPSAAVTYPNVDLGYIYSPTQNNGRIVQSEDYVSGEEVNYSYDSLNRLILAETTGSQWGQSFSYDGFGNLTSEQAAKGTAYSANFNYNATTNRIATAGYQYDANGNLTAMPNAGMTYDIENRLAQATQTVNGTELYGYGLGNRRVWKQSADGTEEFYLYGPGGEKLGTYTVMSSGYFFFQEKKTDVYFRQQLIWEGPLASGTGAGGALVLDRLGTAVVKDGQKYAYFPYGEPRVGTGDHFATYQRDATGFDYALNRYYSNVAGRFLTPDPYGGSAWRINPQSWNRYTYAGDDPVNANDPEGLNVTWLPPAGGEEGPPQGACDIFPNMFFPECGRNEGAWIGMSFLFNETQLATWEGGTSHGWLLTVKGLSTTSVKAVTVQNDLRWLQQAILDNSDCAKWLNGSTSAINYMLNTPGSGATAMMVGVGSFSPSGDNAAAGTGGTNLTPGSMLITVNVNGAFFKPGPSTAVGYGVPSWITGGTDAAKALILLHELAHDLGAAGFDQNDGDNPAAQAANNSLVMQNCGDVVKQAAGAP